MPRLFGERIRLPQVFAALLLCVFLAQCLWFVARVPLVENEGLVLQSGAQQLRGISVAGTQQNSPLISLVAALPVVGKDTSNVYLMIANRWAIRAPFLLMGVLLGGSLWYVARRLYGDVGGYIALVLYIFSPFLIIRSALLQPDVPAAWGAFGLIFTGIAVAHTLYAPREVVLWNWKRIVLLGIAVCIAVGAQYSAVWILLPALAYMLWLAPVRRGAAITIFAAACVVGFVALSFSFVPHPEEMVAAFRQASWGEFDVAQLAHLSSYRLVGAFFRDNSLPALLLLIIALGTYIAWPRTRYFGTTAPLLAGLFCVLLCLVMPHFGGRLFLFVSLPMFYVFVAGVLTDLLETRFMVPLAAIVVGALLVHGAASVMGLVQLTHLTR